MNIMPYKDKEKQRAYQNQWMKARRDKYLNGKICEKCGSVTNLEIHHIDPKQKENHKIWSWSEERLLKELEKCITLCSACHQNHHAAEMSIEIPHGTHTGYSHHGCRCSACKESQRQYMSNFRNSRVAQLAER